MVGVECGDFPLLLGREGEFRATANKEEILKVGRLAKSNFDSVLKAKQEVSNSEAQAEKRRESTSKDSYSKTTTCLKEVLKTLGTVLDWFDESCSITGNYSETKGTVDGNKPENTPDYQKNESVLRGLCHIIVLGRYTSTVGFLELAAELLDVPENWYKQKLKHINECLNEVEKKNQKVDELVEKACYIMEEIVGEPEVDRHKASVFNSIVRQAEAIIESCKNMLSLAKATVDKLLPKMYTIKYISRLLRFAGLVAACYVVSCNIPSIWTMESLVTYYSPVPIDPLKYPGLNYVGYVALFLAIALVCFALSPGKARAFLRDLEDLEDKQKRLNVSLHELEMRLKLAKEDVQARIFQ